MRAINSDFVISTPIVVDKLGFYDAKRGATRQRNLKNFQKHATDD